MLISGVASRSLGRRCAAGLSAGGWGAPLFAPFVALLLALIGARASKAPPAPPVAPVCPGALFIVLEPKGPPPGRIPWPGAPFCAFCVGGFCTSESVRYEPLVWMRRHSSLPVKGSL